jgi:hypothetical protein
MVLQLHETHLFLLHCKNIFIDVLFCSNFLAVILGEWFL